MRQDLLETALVHRITRREFNAMCEAGVFDDAEPHDATLELIDGFLVVKPAVPSPVHERPVRRLIKLFGRIFADRDDIEIGVNSPFAAGDLYQPQPDLYVIPKWDDVADHPDRSHLMVEVSPSRLVFDRTVKYMLYAWLGIPEYWIVNVDEGVIEVHRQPTPDGYRSTEVCRPGDVIRVVEFPSVEVAVADVLT